MAPRSPTPATALLVLLAMGTPLAAADLTPDQIFEQALSLWKDVQDYTATVRIATDVAGTPSRELEAKVYYKRSDPKPKVYVESKHFLIVPKEVFMFGNLDKHKVDADIALVAREKQDGRDRYKLKIAGKEAGPKRGHLLVWIDAKDFTVHRIEAIAGDKQRMWADWSHTLVGGKHWMPQRIVVWFKLGPRMRRGRHQDPDEAPERPAPDSGKLTITFSDYKVNSGLTDEFFDSKKR